MENKFYNEQDLEQFLQEQVQKHRIYPSDATWNGIYNELQGHRRWPGLMLVAVCIVAALTLGTIFTPQQKIRTYTQTIEKQALNLNPTATIQKNGEEINNEYFAKTNAAEKTTAAFIATVKEELNNQSVLMANTTNTVASTSPLTDNINTTTAEKKISYENPIGTNDFTVIKISSKKASAKSNENEMGKMEGLDEEHNLLLSGSAIASATPKIGSTTTDKTKKKTAETENNDKHTTVDDYISQLGYNKTDYKKGKVSKWETQFYIAPSVSYRKLIDESAKYTAATPLLSNNPDDANKVARYKPGNGIEGGASLLYALNKRVKLKTGLQFNVRQYAIDAYLGNTEQATLLLINNGVVDSLNTFAMYRSSYGYSPAVLNNRYYSISLPIGVEVNVLNYKKLGVNVAATIQPTYSFSDTKYYVLSSNYKNYTDGSSLFRTWNINSSVEASITYAVGKYKWQVGPQLRYQHLPTFISKYPIKEHLLDYGIKIGFTKTLH